MERICLIYNFAQHYRENIFSLIDRNLPCDFVFGDKHLDVKKLDYSKFQNSVSEVSNISIGAFVWQKGIFTHIKKEHTKLVIYGSPLFLSTWVLLFYCKFFTTKRTYLWGHGWYGRENFLKKIIKKIFFGLSNGVLVYGDYAKRNMLENGFADDFVHVFYNSLAYDEQLQIRKKLKPASVYSDRFGNNLLNLIFVGRLTKVKRLDFLLQALSKLNSEKRKYNLTLVGVGEDLENLKTLVKELGVERQVCFFGASYDETELSQLIYNADLCVAPGNVGLTAMHSMVYGCPVITHDNFKWQMPEFESIKPDITGSYFEYNNLNSLVENIDKWFAKEKNRDVVRQSCYHEIDNKWNPHVQLKILTKVLHL